MDGGGLPTEGLPLTSHLSIMWQVQITVGQLVMVAVILGALVSPWFLILAGLYLGCGLFFAGMSGTCGLAAVLKLMPWNRRSNSSQRGSTGARCCS